MPIGNQCPYGRERPVSKRQRDPEDIINTIRPSDRQTRSGLSWKLPLGRFSGHAPSSLTRNYPRLGIVTAQDTMENSFLFVHYLDIRFPIAVYRSLDIGVATVDLSFCVSSSIYLVSALPSMPSQLQSSLPGQRPFHLAHFRHLPLTSWR